MRKLILNLLVVIPSWSFAGTVSISGISSGGFMASQMATIYSDQISGVATVAGGVYYCAQNHFQEKLSQYGDISYLAFGVTGNGILKGLDPWNISLNQNGDHPVEPLEINPIYQSVGICMGHPEQAHNGSKGPMDLEFLNKVEDLKLIAPTKNIAKQRVLIFQGKNDEVVGAAMADKLQEFYTRMGVSNEALKVVSGEGNHNFPTDRTDGIGCDQEQVPYIASCNLDLAGNILKHILGRSLERGSVNTSHLYRVEQVKAPESVAPFGYFYASDSCLKNPDSCDLHVALHGCKMSDDYDENFERLYESKLQISRVLGMQDYEMKVRVPQMGARIFAEKAGYAEYAEVEKNHVMIYFPQTRISTANYPANPKGCWDWYGWTGKEYATNRGQETSWLMAQIKLLKKNPSALILTEGKNISSMLAEKTSLRRKQLKLPKVIR